MEITDAQALRRLHQWQNEGRTIKATIDKDGVKVRKHLMESYDGAMTILLPNTVVSLYLIHKPSDIEPA